MSAPGRVPGFGAGYVAGEGDLPAVALPAVVREGRRVFWAVVLCLLLCYKGDGAWRYRLHLARREKSACRQGSLAPVGSCAQHALPR